jgi:predicted nucleic acid-binding Zn ribbon protein
VLPIQNFASGVIAEIIRRQPASKERTAFAWQLAVGPALARVTTVELKGTVLEVRAKDLRWMPEIERARPAVLAKLQHLLGPDAVRSLKTRH